jgi:hypothetical protein
MEESKTKSEDAASQTPVVEVTENTVKIDSKNDADDGVVLERQASAELTGAEHDKTENITAVSASKENAEE